MNPMENAIPGLLGSRRRSVCALDGRALDREQLLDVDRPQQGMAPTFA
jgi:hypothetical protein